MIKILKYLNKKEFGAILLILLFVVLQVWLDLKMPDYMSEITVLIQSESGVLKDILINGTYMLLCAFGSLVFASLNGYVISKLSSGFSHKLREKIFTKVTKLSMGDVKEFSTSSLITRTTNDVNQVEMVVSMGFQMLFKAPITAVWAIRKILNKSFQWSALTGVALIIVLTVLIFIFSNVFPKFKIIQKLIDKLNGVTRENLTGIRVVRAFNANEYQEKKFDDVNKELAKTQLFTQKAFAFMRPTMMLVMNSLTLSIFFVGAYLISSANLLDKITIFGNMVVFSSYAMQVIMSFVMLAMIFMMIPRAEVSAKRINEVLDKEITILEGNKNIHIKQGVVEFKDVSFKYPDASEYLLKNINFKVESGTTVAFIGSTGSGKSTLINLIPRFYDVTDGEILINGVNVKDYTEKSLNDNIGYVSQKPIIFNGSIKYNVSYGKDVDLKTIKEAIKVAQASDFVLKMKDKYNTDVAQGGTNISGGQKQRISIARAIAKSPNIYIFDDSFSALDYKTDLKLRNTLKKHTGDSTVLIVAQRIGTIMHADKIVVLDKGKIVGIGTHNELLSKNKIYKEIAYSQLSKEELENER